MLNVLNSQQGYWNLEQTHAIAAGDGYDRMIAWK
jgi:uncharacterized membrane protein YfhO